MLSISKMGHFLNRTEKGIDVKVIRPRAILVIGSRAQLDSPNKDKDFRVLQDSLKNVEVIPYDDLLIRLKNQKNKVFV
ncbi:Shedu anti-phage system protein SduA domain-containing protein [Chloroflexota bacterium]